MDSLAPTAEKTAYRGYILTPLFARLKTSFCFDLFLKDVLKSLSVR